MASNNGFDAKKMFELYLHDYFVKNNMHETAENFRKEVNVDPNYPVALDVPDGFLHEWWCIFYEFAARQINHQESEPETSSEVINLTENQPQVLRPMMPQFALNQQRPRQFPISTHFDRRTGEQATSLLAAKFQGEEHFKHSDHLRQHIINSQSQQRVVRDNLQGFDFGRTTMMDPAPDGAQRATLHGAGMNGLVNPIPPNVWPLDESGLTSSCLLNSFGSTSRFLGNKPLHSFFQAPNPQKQFQMSIMQHQQPILAPTQSFTPGNLTSSFPGSSADFSCRNLTVPNTDLNRMNAQMAVPMRQTAQHRLQRKQPQNQQLQEKGRRRNKSSLSRAKDSESLEHMKAKDRKPANENVKSVSSHDVTVDSSTTVSNKN